MPDQTFEVTRAPYASPQGVMLALHYFRSRQAAGHLTPSNLEVVGLRPVAAARALQTLRFLGFIREDNSPSEELRAFTYADVEGYKSILTQALHRAYSSIFAGIEGGNPSLDDLINLFKRHYTPPAQGARMARLFIALCKECGEPIRLSSAERVRVRYVAQPTIQNYRPGATMNRVDVLQDMMSMTAHPLILGLIALLPPPGRQARLTPDELKDWLSTADSVLRAIYKVKRRTASSGSRRTRRK